MQLKSVQMGWKGLELVLNKIIEAINTNEPIEGAGIRIEDKAKGGKIIELAALAQGQGPSDGNTQVVSAPGTSTTQISLYGVKWQQLTVVDPATCVQSTVTVIVSGSATDSIALSVSPSLLTS